MNFGDSFQKQSRTLGKIIITRSPDDPFSTDVTRTTASFHRGRCSEQTCQPLSTDPRYLALAPASGLTSWTTPVTISLALAIALRSGASAFRSPATESLFNRSGTEFSFATALALTAMFVS